MTFLRYLAVALVLGVSTALVGAVVSQPSNSFRLFVRSLRWGVATGAATGAAFGGIASLVGSFNKEVGPALGLTLAGVVVGGVAGAIVTLLPTLIGGLLLTAVLGRRHPQPTSEAGIQRDLTGIFAAVVAVLDVILLVALVAGGDGFSSAAIALPLIAVGNACVVVMLGRARRSISRLWIEVAGR